MRIRCIRSLLLGSCIRRTLFCERPKRNLGLTVAAAAAQTGRMNKILIVLAAAALAACDNSDHTIVARGPGDPNAAEVNTVGIVLPPAIVASKIYRCKDNDVVYID